jgi:hypothetical protein
MGMNEPTGSTAQPSIPATVIPQLTATAAKIAASHGEPTPASITAVATTRAKALDVVCHGTKIPGTQSVPVYAVVMTGHFISHRRPPGPRQHRPLTGTTLAVILDASTLTLMDLSLSDHDDTTQLPALGTVTTLKTQ